MKIQRTFCFAAMVLITQLAVAKLPFTNDIFGKEEGTLDYCARVDSKSADKYQLKKRDLVKDVEARKTEEYKAGYDWIDGELAKMTKHEIVSACAAALNSKN